MELSKTEPSPPGCDLPKVGLSPQYLHYLQPGVNPLYIHLHKLCRFPVLFHSARDQLLM